MSDKTVTSDPRTEYTAGLRMLADLLDAHPDLGLPFNGTSMPLTVLVTGKENQKGKLAAWAKALPGKKSKKSAGVDGDLFKVVASLRGLKVMVLADRDEVCERITTGVRKVTKEVPDPQALAKVPTVTVTEEVETYEWICKPILGDEPVAVPS